eukprot:3812322-Prorocentrum_lima.AAC.1
MGMGSSGGMSSSLSSLSSSRCLLLVPWLLVGAVVVLVPVAVGSFAVVPVGGIAVGTCGVVALT